VVSFCNLYSHDSRSARLVFDMRVYLCLSYCGRIRDGKSDIEAQLDDIATYKKAIEQIAEVNPLNFKAWLLLLNAEVADVRGDRYEGKQS
jgi:hypothetical protein